MTPRVRVLTATMLATATLAFAGALANVIAADIDTELSAGLSRHGLNSPKE